MTSNPLREPAAAKVPVAHSAGRLKRLTEALDGLSELPVERLDEDGCRRHHRAYDRGRLELHRHPDGTPTLRTRDGPNP